MYRVLFPGSMCNAFMCPGIGHVISLGEIKKNEETEIMKSRGMRG